MRSSIPRNWKLPPTPVMLKTISPKSTAVPIISVTAKPVVLIASDTEANEKPTFGKLGPTENSAVSIATRPVSLKEKRPVVISSSSNVTPPSWRANTIFVPVRPISAPKAPVSSESSNKSAERKLSKTFIWALIIFTFKYSVSPGRLTVCPKISVIAWPVVLIYISRESALNDIWLRDNRSVTAVVVAIPAIPSGVNAKAISSIDRLTISVASRLSLKPRFVPAISTSLLPPTRF